jgi:DHA1 family bicyclomycin/chloramphenicol resistance-like MFS transporter
MKAISTNFLTLLLAGLAMIGPFSIDTYLPSFPDIARGLAVNELLVQQTLSVYLVSFAFMMLFHGTLSDTFGRRPIILIALVVYACASVGAAWSPTLHWLLFFRGLQGMSAGAGVVIGRAIVRDRMMGADAQRALAQITMVFGLAPAGAPIIGGWLQSAFGWRSVFVFLCILAVVLLVVAWHKLPETLLHEARQPLHPGTIATNYATVLRSARFALLALSVGLGFAGFGLYIASAPYFVMQLLGLPETAFAWLFIPMVSGLVGGAWVASRCAHTVVPGRMIRHGYTFMGIGAAINMLYNLAYPPTLPWAVLPLTVYTFGLALVMPSVTLRILDLFPGMRGLAASLQSFVQTAVFAGISAIAPLFFGSGFKLSCGLALACVGSMLCYARYRALVSRS